MPELPEVETICQGLKPYLLGRHFISIDVRFPRLRYAIPLEITTLSFQTISHLRRRAKYLLLDCASSTLIIHLGMSGRLSLNRPLEKHDHVVFTLDSGDTLTYHDPRRFGLLDVTQTAALSEHPLFRHLGFEPFDRCFTGKWLHEKIKHSHTAIKYCLLDQRVVVGIGNIYASEALFDAAISPVRACQTLTLSETNRLVKSVLAILERAIKAGGTTLRDFQHPTGNLGYFQHQFSVYGKEGQDCPRCTTASIQRIFQGQRATYFCPNCQR